MYKFSMCEICPVNQIEYKMIYRGDKRMLLLQPLLDQIHPFDVEFLLRNWMHYRIKLASISTNDIEKEHARKQLKRILWIVNQYGIDSERFHEHFKYQHDLRWYNMNVNRKKEN